MQTLKDLYYKELPLSDFDGGNIVFIEKHGSISQTAVKLLLKEQNQHYGIKAAEDEIMATSAIESIDFSRDSVRKILKGMAPKDEQENRISGIKHGLEFIADTANKITEENLYRLYMMTVGDFLSGEDKLERQAVRSALRRNIQAVVILSATGQGICTSSTKQRLEELEMQKRDIEAEIAKESIARPMLSREQTVFSSRMDTSAQASYRLRRLFSNVGARSPAAAPADCFKCFCAMRERVDFILRLISFFSNVYSSCNARPLSRRFSFPPCFYRA